MVGGANANNTAVGWVMLLQCITPMWTDTAVGRIALMDSMPDCIDMGEW